MLAQVNKGDVGRQFTQQKLFYGMCQEDLPAMGGRFHSCRPVHGWAEVIVGTLKGRAAVQSHARCESTHIGRPLLFGEAKLGLNCGCESIGSMVEGRTECIADSFENIAFMGFDGSAHDGIMTQERCLHGQAVFFP